MQKEGFDPSAYTGVDEQGHPIEVPFVRKDAAESKVSVDKLARLAQLTGQGRTSEGGQLRGVDILHGQAFDYDKERTRLISEFGQEGYNTLTLYGLPEQFKEDKGIVLAAVKHKGSELQYATETLKGDKDVVLAAVGENAWAYRYASENMRGDPDVALLAVKQDPTLLEHTPASIKDNKEVVLAAIVSQPKYSLTTVPKGVAFNFASSRLQNDIDVVLAAVELDPNYINKAGLDIRSQLKELS